ncbi:4-(cytidine 5'-diphospho)-2-C-methyl-D-erythritol kinase [Aestuariicoccus sp. MJ-SS9]|uniref:4-(cytidine 5'-diphospho)-2-C-methyl-D-erythritol kinase n=1 Tax=Aestuariicoccus sp. MJ-SS9 TaxID=3079855 RepID=UPI00290FDAF1|nr:4-(cytidine 5'-diphospho)-2-C-methyl-D-erythritol kinase [Aestuariicoccus sp. MJ-SS9]MDU8913810.1 4-(cytidine 5'-diphospho)-2-C-methyl-D-erythritol kinase [Aestuariicoccus sp. MJ-SS9]
MATNEATAPAKINLCLYLTGLREDGYHLLESLVVFADLGDRLRVAPADELTLTVDGPFAEGVPTDGGNLVLKTAERLRTLRGVTAGASIQLTKHLPHGGGIGGGSSDAACALSLLADLWQVAPLTTVEALPLGADVPVCLCAPQAMEMRGIGEDLTPAPYQPEGWLVLANPRVAVPTGAVFALHDRISDFSPQGMEPLDGIGKPDDFVAWLRRQRNDLTRVACEDGIAPVIGDVLAALRVFAEVAEMSGSGSTCWALFRDEATAQTCADAIAADHPGWWVRAARLLLRGKPARA